MKALSLVVALGLLCLVAGEARSRTFEQQVLEVHEQLGPAAARLRQYLAVVQLEDFERDYEGFSPSDIWKARDGGSMWRS